MEWKLWRKTDRKRFQNFNTGISTIRAATEHAKIRIAQLHGHTLRDRAKQLIAIAAPEFREELQREYKRRFQRTV